MSDEEREQAVMSEVDLMSLGIEPCRSWQLVTTPTVCSAHGSHWVGPYCEFAMGVLEGAHRAIELDKSGVSTILQDLLAELRETAATYPGATGRLLMEMAGSAEARLRELEADK